MRDFYRLESNPGPRSPADKPLFSGGYRFDFVIFFPKPQCCDRGRTTSEGDLGADLGADLEAQPEVVHVSSPVNLGGGGGGDTLPSAGAHNELLFPFAPFQFFIWAFFSLLSPAQRFRREPRRTKYARGSNYPTNIGF